MNLANQITFLRLLLVPLFIGSLFYELPHHASLGTLPAIIFSVACATDALDGWVAKTTNTVSRLGTMLDPIVDKILILSSFITMSFLETLPTSMRIPVWLSLTVITRDVILLLGSGMIYMLHGKFEPQPNRAGKITAACQMFLIACLLWRLPLEMITFLVMLTAILTVISGSIYTYKGAQQINHG